MMKSLTLALADTQTIGEDAHASQGWRQLGSCVGLDPELWYPIGSGGGTAVKICMQCSVRLDCLGWALAHNEPDGIWGGVSARERERLRSGKRLASDSALGKPRRKRTRGTSVSRPA
jgi:WhiB family transcriptional regulator, redox-sensing transcriptional regulator